MQAPHKKAYFRHHKITKKSTGADLEQAVMVNPTGPHPLPHVLLHIMYAYQYKVESLQGCRCTRDLDGDSITEWVLQWKPTVVLLKHAPSMVTMESDLLNNANWSCSPNKRQPPQRI